MAVKVADKMVQMNNQDYPLIDASAVEYEDTNGNTIRVDKEDGKSLLSDIDKAKYDDAVTKAHKHTSSTVLDKLGENADGNPTLSSLHQN